jgi:hypothetical protein
MILLLLPCQWISSPLAGFTFKIQESTFSYIVQKNILMPLRLTNHQSKSKILLTLISPPQFGGYLNSKETFMFHTIIIVGNVGSPNALYPSGQAVTFRLHQSPVHHGQWRTGQAIWFRATMGQAEICNQYLKKGSRF